MAIVSANVELSTVDQYTLRERIDRVECAKLKLEQVRSYYEELDSIVWKEREAFLADNPEPKEDSAFKMVGKAIKDDVRLQDAMTALSELLVFLDKCAPKALASSNVFDDVERVDECE